MKVATTPQTTLVQGEVESVDMGMTKQGQIAAVKMFRDQIYSFKEWATIRETLANAIDEQKRHSVSRALEISLPTSSDPMFRVRDFAKGLPKRDKRPDGSDRGVLGTFFQYFASTKSNSDSDIGGFGIGAKAPLCYAEVFYVTSYFGGIKTSYVSALDGDGSKAHTLGESPTTETGIEVAVPVESADFAKFSDLVSFYLACSDFDNFKIVNGTLPETKWADSYSNKFGAISNFEHPCYKEGNRGMYSWNRRQNKKYARMEGILYEIDFPINGPTVSDNLILEVSNSEIEVHPSRERVAGTKRNKVVLQNRLDEFVALGKKEFTDQLKNCTTAREKFKVALTATGAHFVKNDVSLWPSKVCVNKNDHIRVEWDSNYMERGNYNTCFSRYSTQESIDPNGISHSSVILTQVDTVRTEYIVAFAEKHGLASPVLVVKGAELPDDWVEGSDAWTFSDDSVTKDEAKAIRDRYKGQSSGVAPSSKTIMGYRSFGKSSYDVQEYRELASPQKYILIPQASLGGWSEAKDLIWLLGKCDDKVRPLFVYDSNLKNWKKDLPTGVTFETWAEYKKTFGAKVQRFINKHQVWESPIRAFISQDDTLSKTHADFLIRTEQGMRGRVGAAFSRSEWSHLKPVVNVPAQIQRIEKNWKDADSKTRELVRIHFNERRNFPHVAEDGKALWQKML